MSDTSRDDLGQNDRQPTDPAEIITDDGDTTGGDDSQPRLRIVHGDPSPEELAALTALIAAASGEVELRPRERRGGWSDPGSMHRPPGVSGPNGWRAAYAPR